MLRIGWEMGDGARFGGSLSNLNKIYSDWMASIFVEAEAEAVLPLIRELFPRWYVDTHPTPTNTLLYFFSGFFVRLRQTY